MRRGLVRWSPLDTAEVAASATKKSVLLKGRGTQGPARSDSKLSKLRNIQSALDRDRTAFEAQKPFSLVESLKTFPWKLFASFMMVWTYAGWYVIPAFKGLNPDGTMTETTEETAARRQLHFKVKERRKLLERRRDLADQKALIEQDEERKIEGRRPG
jgi:hypothetical protein